MKEQLNQFKLELDRLINTVDSAQFDTDWEYAWWRTTAEELLNETQRAIDGERISNRP